MGCYSIAVLPYGINSVVPIFHLGGERYNGRKVSCPRTQGNDPGKGSSLHGSIQSTVHYQLGHPLQTNTNNQEIVFTSGQKQGKLLANLPWLIFYPSLR